MALLTGDARTATVRAATTLTLLEIERDLFNDLMERHAGMSDHVWSAHARRSFDNTVHGHARFAHLGSIRRREWIGDRSHITLAPGEPLDVDELGDDAAYLFVVSGELDVGGETMPASTLVDRARHRGQIFAKSECRVVAFVPSRRRARKIARARSSGQITSTK